METILPMFTLGPSVTATTARQAVPKLKLDTIDMINI